MSVSPTKDPSPATRRSPEASPNGRAPASPPPAVEAIAPRALFLGSTYGGHHTRFLNLEANTHDDPRIRPSYRPVRGWVVGGLVERLPLLPAGLKGRARAVWQSKSLARLPRPDVIWTSAKESLLPHLWSQLGPLRRPLVLDLDWTLEQQEELAPVYYKRPPKRGLRRLIARMEQRALWSTVTLFTPWSRWVADAIVREGVAPERVRIIPPGVDTEQWKPEPKTGRGDKLRLLFVGGDFERKGGELLLEALRGGFADRCELDIVTREAVAPPEGVRVHRAEPNSPELRRLYAEAEVFVMPSLAECFGIATVEAMASGLPVIVGDVGGARDIVDHSETGWLIEPAAADLAKALESALAAGDGLRSMGVRARAVAEGRFDARKNGRAVIDALLEAREQFREAR
ncbi:MAG: glycosyltransferase family 4 protein [Dehalococcoidia bacterium]